MKATFDRVVRYDVTAVCVTPLRTANASGDVDCVLRDADGTPIIQGASLAGALRGWLKAAEVDTEGLFGCKIEDEQEPRTVEGRLSVSDGRFTPDAVVNIRPRVRIDHATGSASDKGKFDVANIAAGSEFRFTVLWKGTDAARKEIETVEQLLAAMDAGEIRLGGQKTNGFGRVKLAVKKLELSMYDVAQRKKWLRQEEATEEIALPKAPGGSDVQFRVYGRADSILVKASAMKLQKKKDQEKDKDSYYQPNIEEGGAAVLPGSSVKGAVRGRCRVIAQSVGLPVAFTDTMFGRGMENGDNGMAGRVRFADVRLSGKREKITRIRLNRFTGGVMRSGPFTEEPLCCEVEIPVQMPGNGAECALMLLALRDLGLGLYNLGSSSAVGRGQIKVSRIEMRAPDGKTAVLRFDDAMRCTLEDKDGLCSGWMEAWKEARGR